MTKALKNYEKAYKDYKRGMSYKKIAEKHNVSLNTVRTWKLRHFNRLAEEEQAEAERKCAEKEYQDAHRLNSVAAAKLLGSALDEAEGKGPGKGSAARQDSENIKAARQLVEIKRASAPPAFKATDTGLMINRIGQYFQRQAKEGRICTRAGIMLALGITKDTYYRYLNGEMDYLLEEHLTINNIDFADCEKIELEDGSEIPVDVAGNPLISHSEILQKAVLRLEEQAEERLYSRARPGDIFTMKQYGWTDERSAQTVNNTLVIATAEESDRALKMLYGI